MTKIPLDPISSLFSYLISSLQMVGRRRRSSGPSLNRYGMRKLATPGMAPTPPFAALTSSTAKLTGFTHRLPAVAMATRNGEGGAPGDGESAGTDGDDGSARRRGAPSARLERVPRRHPLLRCAPRHGQRPARSGAPCRGDLLTRAAAASSTPRRPAA
uniref:Uncharacterized protein n=1 Tax=Oryza sativa subsp. japonica TaxID=39947 RepID=Q6Z7A4_ORYSJ|nr:hypothetical protein [Oryza sativa Japonica Group]BAD25479.1 hypothetical protein [Oryza sativa Japonica Group]